MTKTTTHKFYIVDLVRNKPKTEFITIPTYRVDVQIDVTSKGTTAVPSSAMKRLEDAARAELARYEDTIRSEAVRLDQKIAELMAKPSAQSKAEAESLAQGTDASIKKALASAEGAAQKAVDERLRREAQGDKNLTEARARTGLKWGMGAIKITGAVAKLVVTAGADVSSYVTIGSTLWNLGKDLEQQLKNEAGLRKDLSVGVESYLALRGTVIMQAARENRLTSTAGIEIKQPLKAIETIASRIKGTGNQVTKGKDTKTIAKDIKDLVVKKVKSNLNDAEKARTAYREHTTKTRHKVDNVSREADKLHALLKKSPMGNETIKLGAETMALKREVSAMAQKLADRERFLDGMQVLMKDNGLTIDDRTTLDKIRELDKKTILTEGKNAVSNIQTIYKTTRTLAQVFA